MLGLGPVLHRAAGEQEGLFPSGFELPVACADLAAKDACNRQTEALRRILVNTDDLSDHITLLKGIDTRDGYPDRHLRRMGDIDLLVGQQDRARLEHVLRELGFEWEPLRMPEDFYDEHHHSRPFVHPETGVRIEVHHELAGRHSVLGSVEAFRDEVVRAHRRLTDFEGLPVYRLEPELRFVYVAAHWCYDLRFPFVLNGLVDTMLMLEDPVQDLDWELVSRWLEDRRVATALYVLLTYLERHGLAEINSSFRRALRRSRRSVGPVGVRFLHSILNASLRGRLYGRLDLRNPTSIVWRSMIGSSRPLWNVFRVPSALLFSPGPDGRVSFWLKLRRLKSLFRGTRKA